jgi:hypothetical protein
MRYCVLLPAERITAWFQPSRTIVRLATANLTFLCLQSVGDLCQNNKIFRTWQEESEKKFGSGKDRTVTFGYLMNPGVSPDH